MNCHTSDDGSYYDHKKRSEGCTLEISETVYERKLNECLSRAVFRCLKKIESFYIRDSYMADLCNILVDGFNPELKAVKRL